MLQFIALYKDNHNRHANTEDGKLRRPQPYTKNLRQPRNAKGGETVFPREEHSNWLFSTEWSDLKAHIHNILSDYNLCNLEHMCTYTNICI